MPPALLPGLRPNMSGEERELGAAMWRVATKAAEENGKDIVVIDNRSVSYRMPKDENLIVVRAPHEVRPLCDTGIRHWFDEVAGHVQLSLEDAPEMPCYGRDFLEMETEHHLCLACLDVVNYYCRYRQEHAKRPGEKQPRVELANSVVHHHNIYSLLARANIDECYLCQRVWQYLKKRYGDKLSSSNYELFRTEVCWLQRAEPDERDVLYFVITNPSCDRDDWNFAHFYRMDLWPSKHFSSSFDLALDLIGIETDQMLPADWEHTDLPGNRDLAASWLSRCRANEGGKHKECNKRHRDYLPSRLIDVKHAQKTGKVRLVNPTEAPLSFADDRDWMTLSHCWGAWGAAENPLLTLKNLEERQQAGLSLSDLPKTFEDAVEVAGWLKINWLWIDCLCIVQDSPSDWLREASIMSETYQNALINVSADSGIDSRAGLFSERHRLAITPIEIQCPQTSLRWKILPAPQFLFDWMEYATSFSRAWIHRERQLARRVLHFTNNEIIWECCGVAGTSFASEMIPGGAPFKDYVFGTDHKFQVGRLQEGLVQDAEETYAMWNDVCERLSEKKLTLASDMPIILSGLAKDFSRALPADEYVAGLWRSTLPESLVWHAKTFKPDSLEYIAPSWSWLSTGSVVTLASRAQRDTEVPIAAILTVLAEPKYEDVHGPLKSGTLQLKGFLRLLRLSFVDNDHGDESEIFNIGVHDSDDDEHVDKEAYTENRMDSNSFRRAIGPIRKETLNISVYDGDDNDLDDTEACTENCVDSNNYWRAIGPTWREYDGSMCDIQLDQTLKSSILDCFCFFISIQQWESNKRSHREITCLLLKRLDGKGNNFTRIGMLTLMDLYAIKMRYKMDEDLDDKTWYKTGDYIDKEWRDIVRISEENRSNNGSDESDVESFRNEDHEGGDDDDVCQNDTDQSNEDDDDEKTNERGSSEDEDGDKQSSESDGGASDRGSSDKRSGDAGESESESDEERDADELTDALYQFDRLLRHQVSFRKLEPQVITIV